MGKYSSRMSIEKFRNSMIVILNSTHRWLLGIVACTYRYCEHRVSKPKKSMEKRSFPLS